MVINNRFDNDIIQLQHILSIKYYKNSLIDIYKNYNLESAIQITYTKENITNQHIPTTYSNNNIFKRNNKDNSNHIVNIIENNKNSNIDISKNKIKNDIISKNKSNSSLIDEMKTEKNLIKKHFNSEDIEIREDSHFTDSNVSEITSEYEENYILSLKSLKEEYYPIFPNHINGYSCYYDIHRLLLSKLDNKKNFIYHDYIEDLQDEEMINERKKFRDLCKNYELNNYNELCFKKLKKTHLRKNKKIRINRH